MIIDLSWVAYGKLKITDEKKRALRVGFEPTRENPSDFESDALTTRPSQHTLKKTKYSYSLVDKSFLTLI